MSADDGALFALPEPPAAEAGEVEAATRRSVDAAQLDERDAGLAAALIAHARSLDRFAREQRASYGTTHGLPPFVEAARALGLSPDAESRKDTGTDDEFTRLMRQLAAPTMGDSTPA